MKEVSCCIKWTIDFLTVLCCRTVVLSYQLRTVVLIFVLVCSTEREYCTVCSTEREYVLVVVQNGSTVCSTEREYVQYEEYRTGVCSM